MTATARVLLVDDESAITGALVPFLTRSGFTVNVANNGREGLALVETLRPDIVVSDVIMPVMDGREMVRQIRAQDGWIPIILLTQVDASYERSAALDEGADDYLSKPFDPQELVSRIRAILRRSQYPHPGTRKPLSAADRLSCGALELDRVSRRIFISGTEVSLTPKAFMLLDYLMTHPGELHTRERLLAALWGIDFASSTRAVDHRIREIRSILIKVPELAGLIETVPSVGYRFVGAVTV